MELKGDSERRLRGCTGAMRSLTINFDFGTLSHDLQMASQYSKDNQGSLHDSQDAICDIGYPVSKLIVNMLRMINDGKVAISNIHYRGFSWKLRDS
jgi:hypothetical protein